MGRCSVSPPLKGRERDQFGGEPPVLRRASPTDLGLLQRTLTLSRHASTFAKALQHYDSQQLSLRIVRAVVSASVNAPPLVQPLLAPVGCNTFRTCRTWASSPPTPQRPAR